MPARPVPSRPEIILVDDDPALANALKFSLELEGFGVRVFADAESLLAMDPPPASGCLILDYALPGIDGLELLDRLRASGVNLPAILITSNPRIALRLRAQAAGAPIVEKPLLTDALLDSVRRALAAESSTPAAP